MNQDIKISIDSNKKDIHIGMIYSNYLIKEKLGAGGFG